MAEQMIESKDTSTLPTLSQSQEPISTPHNINIGTRKSELARVQTDIVIEQLTKQWPQHTWQIHAITTMGDKDKVTALNEFGAKSLWTYELEAMLMDGEVDFIVHSLKDIPTQMRPELTLGAILPREDPRDALVMSPHLCPTPNHSSPTSVPTLGTLPPGSIIGTSSVRRSAQLKRLYPHLNFQSVRGNVDTRLRKLDVQDSQYAAIILAAAGLTRLNLGHRISGFLESSNVEGVHKDPTVAATQQQQKQQQQQQQQHGDGIPKEKWGMLHAVGQGALGIQIREDDARIRELLAPLVCMKTTLACLAERSLMRTLEGGCSVPIGVETEWTGEDTDDDLTMRAIVVSLDGTRAAEATAVRTTLASQKDADEFGIAVANELIKRGAEDILKDINLDRDVLDKQADGA